MKTILSIITISLFLSSNLLWAQKDDVFSNVHSYSASGGKIQIFQDANVRVLMNDYVKSKKNEKGMNGYRVQIFFGSGHNSRENANNTRNAFVSKYQNIPVHVVFEEPNFKVRVGDFRTKSEALEVLMEVKEDYEGAYIVKDFIEFPELD